MTRSRQPPDSAAANESPSPASLPVPEALPVRRGFGRRALLAGAAGLAFVVGVGWSWRRAAVDTTPADRATLDRLFDTAWQDAQQRPLDLKPYKGRVLVLNFWATWCAPCIEEMPELSALANEFAGQPVQLLGIGIDSATNIKLFADKHQISYPLPVAGAAGLEWLRGLGNSSGGLPFTVVFDSQGRVQGRYLGRIDIVRLREQLRSLARG